MKYDFNNMLTNGKMAKELGVDPKTLRQWAKAGLIPSYENPANGYRFYDRLSVIKALRLQGLEFEIPVDAST
jgi:DNA-binding transcriptional MerR regulator